MHRTITTIAAVSFTGLAVGLAVASAGTRAASPHATVLLAGLSVAVVLAVHLSPALLRSVPRLVLWPVWTAALVGALWAHASFLASTAADAGDARQASSPAAAARADERAEIERAISEIKARPAATIARQLSWTTDPQRAAALQVELAEARRADDLRQQLIALAGAATAAATAAAADPLTAHLADAFGVTPDAVQLAAALLLAVLLEVIGMLLWREALSSKKDAHPDQPALHPTAPAAAPQAQAAVQAGMQQIVQISVHQPAPAAAQHVQHDAPELVQTVDQQTAPLLSDAGSDDVARLRAAVVRGECLPTVTGIRQYLRCGQVRARELRRALDAA
jgi:hypothetical protein